jgi:hypothetical protein
MRRLTVGLALTIAFAVGCVTAQLVVPRARAQAGAAATTAPSRWEYMCVDGWAGITHSANQLGKEGWEMASAAGTSDHMMWCFKRSLP